MPVFICIYAFKQLLDLRIYLLLTLDVLFCLNWNVELALLVLDSLSNSLDKLLSSESLRTREVTGRFSVGSHLGVDRVLQLNGEIYQLGAVRRVGQFN